MPTRLQTVMFDPLAYVHPQRLSLRGGCEAPAQRAAINDMLFDRYALSSCLDLARGEPAATLLLKHWFRLPQIVFLLGCARMRVALSRRGMSLRLPANVQAFMRLPVLRQSMPDRVSAEVLPTGASARLDRDALSYYGLRQLRAGAGDIPPALAQRLPLLFAPSFDEAARHAGEGRANVGGRTPEDVLILTMAIQHAKKY